MSLDKLPIGEEKLRIRHEAGAVDEFELGQAEHNRKTGGGFLSHLIPKPVASCWKGQN